MPNRHAGRTVKVLDEHRRLRGRITPQRAADSMKDGQAAFVNDRTIALTPPERREHPIHAESIRESHIIRAYGDDSSSALREQDRINRYGELARFGGHEAWSNGVRDVVDKPVIERSTHMSFPTIDELLKEANE